MRAPHLSIALSHILAVRGLPSLFLSPGICVSVSRGPRNWVWGRGPQEMTLPGTRAPPQRIVDPGCEKQLWTERGLTSSLLSFCLSLDLFLNLL